ncbi:MmgE/PrpD family protein [Bradyrhizobium sp. 177]|uniref:MmgE/PrpD family protein n=1 Tax=Bradyrhizobium sp. 177 TaxID=2782647 RepID=UPI001FF90EDC|nr:MmgE/PrpD family protein [Bradyrhizobium sp. 177]MCK1554760.1 MmgE/PrpD family protein [Bradyrhizobium sp. 177]
MAELTATLARFISGLTLERVPATVQHEARRLVLDTLGCVIAGARSELGAVILPVARLFGEGTQASIAGAGRRFTGLAASYGNGRLGNCLDLEETYPGGPVAGVHFGASIFSETLATCEQQHSTLRELLLGVICGYEVAGRMGDAGSQLEIRAGRITGVAEVHGFALAPTIGAATAAGRLLNQDAATLEQSFGMAASNAATPTGPLWSRLVALPNTNAYDSGWAAMAGGFSARSVGLGSTSLPAIFDGEPNIFTMVGARSIDADGLIGDLGSRWALENVLYKPWPSCRAHHPAMYALQKLRALEPFDVEDIEEIILGLNPAKLQRRHVNPEPTTFVAREFSYPHAIAMFLMGVPIGPHWASKRWETDPVASRLRAKIKFTEYLPATTSAKYFVRGQFRQSPCSVQIRYNGRIARRAVEFTWGDPWTDETRFTDGDIVEKFRTVTSLPESVAEPVIDTVLGANPGVSLTPVFDALSAGLH